MTGSEDWAEAKRILDESDFDTKYREWAEGRQSTFDCVSDWSQEWQLQTGGTWDAGSEDYRGREEMSFSLMAATHYTKLLNMGVPEGDAREFVYGE